MNDRCGTYIGTPLGRPFPKGLFRSSDSYMAPVFPAR